MAALARAARGEAVLSLLRGRLQTPLAAPVATAALLSLARCSRERAWAADARVQALLTASAAATFEPSDAARCVWALAKLGVTPQWLSTLLSAATPEALQSRELSLLVFGLGSLRARPPSTAWLAALWASLSSTLPSCTPKDVGMLAYGLGAWAVRPPASLAAAFELESTKLLSACTPCELAHCLYAFTAWAGDAPTERWLRLFWARVIAELPAFKPRELANVLHSSAVLGAPLQPSTLDALEAVTSERMSEFGARELSSTLWSFARLSRVPTEDWLDAWAAESRRKMPTFKVNELSISLWALAHLCHRPSDAWLAAFTAASLPQLMDATPQALANMAWAFAVLDAPPPPAWMDAFAVRALASLDGFTRQGLALCCWALVVLQAYRCAALQAVWERLLRKVDEERASMPSGDAVADEHELARLERFQIDLRTVHEVHMLAGAEAPGLLSSPPAELLSMARTTWLNETGAQASAVRNSSRTFLEVATCLRSSLGLEPSELVLCRASDRIIDLALERGALRLALQVDGPSRFLRNTWQPSGATRLRDRALAAAGWRVLSLPFYTLDELRTSEPRAEYLLRRLADVEGSQTPSV